MASRRRLEKRFAFAPRPINHQRRRRPVLEVLEGRVVLSTFTVNSLGDAGSGSHGSGDLRYCINQANADDQANTIVFASNVFSTPQTITLSGGQLELNDTGGTQTITGPAGGVTISGGGGNSRVFQVDDGVTASISGLTISGGSGVGRGGGLVNYGTATLTGCIISGNAVIGSVYYGRYGRHDATDQGGGVFNGSSANLTLTDCTISGNTAFIRIERAIPGGYSNTYNYYYYGNGGGAFNSGKATLTDCTVSGNDAGGAGFAGGGLYNSGTATLTDCTVSGNSGGAEYNGGTATLTDTIVAGNSGGDIGGRNNVSGSYNLIGTGGSGGLNNGVYGNIVLTSLTGLGLAPLGNFGGPTQTMALLPGSPAIGAGVIADYPGTTTPVTTDQRGEPLDSPNPDIGAFQTQDPTLIPLAFSGISNQVINYGTSSVTVSGTLADGSQAPVGETVAVTLDGDEQPATIGSGGAFSTSFDTTSLTGADSPYTIAYAYTSDGTFASASATSALTVTPPLTIFTVDSLGDAGTGSGDSGDLRYCIDQADADDGPNQIDFDPSLFSTPLTITLSGGPLELSDTGWTQSIIGPAAGVTISGGGSSRVFEVDSGVTASISGLTISGGATASANGGGLANYGTATLTDCTLSGNSSLYGAGLFNYGSATLTDCTVSGNSGGGIYNSANLTLTDCTVSANTAADDGGGLLNTGSATLTDCTVSGNSGGGIYNSASLTLTDCTVSANTGGGVDNSANLYLTDCTVSANTAADDGGGLLNIGTANLMGCTLSGNSASAGGGGLCNDGWAFLTNCTLSGNSSTNGGGVFNGYGSTLALTFCTVSGNFAVEGGGGLYAEGNSAGGQYGYSPDLPYLTCTIVAGNSDSSGASDIGGESSVSGNVNLIGTGGSGGLVNGVDLNTVLTSLTGLGLAPLGSYGGPTQTMALLPGSPAIDGDVLAEYPGGSPTIFSDQRGEPLDSPIPDIGAFQSQGFTLTPAAGSSPQSTEVGTAFVNPLSVSVTANNPVEPVAGGVLTFTAPASGATATLSATTVTIGSDGVVSVTATANLSAGSYTVTATAGGGNSTEFDLTNSVLLTVNRLGDAGIGSNDSGDLRYCIDQANADDGPTQIVFDPTLFSTPQTITLTSGQLELSDTGGAVTITGPAAGVTISGGGNSRVFEIDSGVTASISGLTIAGGSTASANGGGLANYGTAMLTDCTLSGNSASSAYSGGGVYNAEYASLTLTDCLVSGNSAYIAGGLENDGTAFLTDCTVSGNHASYVGGVFNGGAAYLAMTGCTVSDNTSAHSAGGVANFGAATLTDSTISGNSASGDGGGLGNVGSATLTDCTLSGNSANNGGGVFNGYEFALSLTSCTVSANAAKSGTGGLYVGGAGGPYSNSYGYGSAPYLTDTIVAGNTDSSGASDIGGSVSVSGSYNLIGTGGSGGLVNGVDGNIVLTSITGLGLAPLGNNGGPTQTMALLPSSPAIGAGIAENGVTTDQRGNPLDFPNPDIGAYQTQPDLVVNTTADGSASSPGELSLRQAVALADSLGGFQTIAFDPTVFATAQTITLTSGELELSDTTGTVTINGPAAGLTISGGGNSRVFQIDQGVTASISGLTISGGSVSAASGGGIENSGALTLDDCTLSGNQVATGSSGYFGDGGGLANYGTATLNGCTVSGNSAANTSSGYGGGLGGYGGGVSNSGTITLTDCTLSGNSGSGLFNDGTATLTDCTVSGNSGGAGGGVQNQSAVTLTDCTLSGNDGQGGGLWNSGTANLIDSTVSGNNAFLAGGGGVFNAGTANLTDCTVSDNSAAYGGGLHGGTFTLTNTIVAGNTDPSGASDIDSVFYGGTNVSGSDNLIGTGGSGGLANGVNGNIVLTSLNNLGLAPLANNGGPTQTMALLSGSAAIGAGVIADYPGTSTPITTDQRGEPLDSPNPDIGAFQTQGSTLSLLYFSGISNQSITYGTSSVTVSGTLADGSQAPVGESVAVTMDGVSQSATISSGGAFSTAFNADDLTVAGSPYAVTFAYTSDGTYASEGTTSTLTVNPATLTITASPETKVYGTADPALAYTASGFQFSDTAATVLTGALARAEAGTLAGEQAASYAIGQGTLAADSNYTIAFTGSTLTITPAALTVTANQETKVYGTNDPSLTNSVTGLVDTTVNGVTIDDTAASVLTGSLARAQAGTLAGEQVGSYTISQGTLAADGNYTFKFTGSTLKVSAASLTVTADSKTKVYGTSDPNLTDSVTGLVDTTVNGVTIDDTAATVLSGSLARANLALWPESRLAITPSFKGHWPPIATTRRPLPAARSPSRQPLSRSRPIPRPRSTARATRL